MGSYLIGEHFSFSEYTQGLSPGLPHDKGSGLPVTTELVVGSFEETSIARRHF